ncbi:MAG: hypothetical protein CMJ77_20105 [Planctomycetaceae bacterium]|nr:hypothetical protein [Planctomycetaceae bacterium]
MWGTAEEPTLERWFQFPVGGFVTWTSTTDDVWRSKLNKFRVDQTIGTLSSRIGRQFAPTDESQRTPLSL